MKRTRSSRPSKWAAAEELPLEIVGHGSKRGVGRPINASHTLDLSRLAGVTLYEPEELVLSAAMGSVVSWRFFFCWKRLS